MIQWLNGATKHPVSLLYLFSNPQSWFHSHPACKAAAVEIVSKMTGPEDAERSSVSTCKRKVAFPRNPSCLLLPSRYSEVGHLSFSNSITGPGKAMVPASLDSSAWAGMGVEKSCLWGKSNYLQYHTIHHQLLIKQTPEIKISWPSWDWEKSQQLGDKRTWLSLERLREWKKQKGNHVKSLRVLSSCS